MGWNAVGSGQQYQGTGQDPSRCPRIPARYVIASLLTVSAGLTAAGLVVATSQPATPATVVLQIAHSADDAARAAWRTQPVDKIFPPTVGHSGDDYVRLGVALPSGCGVLPAAFTAALAAAAPGTRCVDVLRATYVDSTQTVLATVGIVVVDGTAKARDQVWRQWTPDSDAKNAALMPSVLPVPGTVAAGFADAQRVTWASQSSENGTSVVYAVTAFADGRPGSTRAQLAAGSGRALAGDSPPVEAAVDLSGDLGKILKDLQAVRTSS